MYSDWNIIFWGYRLVYFDEIIILKMNCLLRLAFRDGNLLYFARIFHKLLYHKTNRQIATIINNGFIRIRFAGKQIYICIKNSAWVRKYLLKQKENEQYISIPNKPIYNYTLIFNLQSKLLLLILWWGLKWSSYAN